MPPRPCPQARGRTRASSWPPPQAAPNRRDRWFPGCARRRRARSSSPPRSTWTPAISRPAHTSPRPRAAPASPWRGTPARRATCALSLGWSSPARCWCAGASSGSAESRGRPARRARPPPAPPPPRAAPLQHVARRVVHGRHGGGVAPAEHLRHDPAHAAPELPGAGLAHAVAHEVDRAALPRGAL